MDFLAQLWIPILVSAAAVWFWSFLSHAVLPIHFKDFQPLGDEKRFADAVRPMGIAPGCYTFPFARHKDCRTPEFQAKWKAGPVGMLHVWNPVINMGRNMAISFSIYLVVSVLMAYVGDLAFPHGASFARVWQVMGTIGVLAYTFAALPGMVWFQAPARSVVSHVFDGIVMGLLSGAVFAAMWPASAMPTIGHP